MSIRLAYSSDHLKTIIMGKNVLQHKLEKPNHLTLNMKLEIMKMEFI